MAAPEAAGCQDEDGGGAHHFHLVVCDSVTVVFVTIILPTSVSPRTELHYVYGLNFVDLMASTEDQV